MKNIKDFILEGSNNAEELIQYIEQIITDNKDLDNDECQEVMKDVRNHTKGISDYDINKVNKHFNIKGNVYPSEKVNLEQWVLSMICKGSKIKK